MTFHKQSTDAMSKYWNKIYSTDNAFAATSSEDDSDSTLFTEIKNMLQQISSDNPRHNETELNEWIDGDDDLLPLHSDDCVSNDETVIDEPKMKHEEEISRFNTCLKQTEENVPELGTLHTIRLMRE
ncbi:hypothetical protein Trydic_g426 [Trypoxylus dichotomus]